jgi:uncharacterized oligopeptide transporter (OPT) family protein
LRIQEITLPSNFHHTADATIVVAVTLVSLLLVGILGGRQGLLADPAANRLAVAIVIFITSVIIATAAISNDNLQT